MIHAIQNLLISAVEKIVKKLHKTSQGVRSAAFNWSAPLEVCVCEILRSTESFYHHQTWRPETWKHPCEIQNRRGGKQGAAEKVLAM